MQTPWGLIRTHHAPDAQGVPCLIAEAGYTILSMSIGGHDAQPDDYPWPWIGDNDNEAPFAWRDRRPRVGTTGRFCARSRIPDDACPVCRKKQKEGQSDGA